MIGGNIRNHSCKFLHALKMQENKNCISKMNGKRHDVVIYAMPLFS